MRANLGAVIAALLLSLISSSASAAGPYGVRGIDLSTAVGLSDRARAAKIAAQDASPKQLKQLKLIVLDPGHGGDNQGAIGVADVHEKFLTLELAYALRDAIQHKYPDTRVVLTRYWDKALGLQERIEIANDLGADLFISLHYNAAEHDRAVGVETYFLTTAEATPNEGQVTGSPIASIHKGASGLEHHATSPDTPHATLTNEPMWLLQRDLARQQQHQRSGLLAELIQTQLAAKLPQTINRGVKQANFAVLRGALMPAVVVEAGFVTHPKEGKWVVSDPHRKKVVQALLLGIEAFDERLDQIPK